MALIYERYVMALGDRHSDSTTRLEAYAAWLREGGAVPAHFYVVDLYDFKAPELDILAGLAKSALSLTVGMVSGKGKPQREDLSRRRGGEAHRSLRGRGSRLRERGTAPRARRGLTQTFLLRAPGREGGEL